MTVCRKSLFLSSPVPFSFFVTERRNKKGATVPNRWTTGRGPGPQHPRRRSTVVFPASACSRPYLAGRGGTWQVPTAKLLREKGAFAAGFAFSSRQRPERRARPFLCFVIAEFSSPKRRCLNGGRLVAELFCFPCRRTFLFSSPLPFSSFVTERRNKKGATVPNRWTTGWGPCPQHPRRRSAAGHPAAPCSRPYLAGRGERFSHCGKVGSIFAAWVLM